MKEILLMRHAKSSWKDDRLSDFERPLNKRGKKNAPQMGELLLQEGLLPDIIVSSAAKRAIQTAKLVQEACTYSGEILAYEDLYHAEINDYISVLAVLDDGIKRVLVVGHNPDIEELIEFLSGEYVRMPTAAIARLQLDLPTWGKIRDCETAKLIDVWYPRRI